MRIGPKIKQVRPFADDHCQTTHSFSVKKRTSRLLKQCKRRGSLLVEATLALGLLIAIALILVKLSLDVLVPRTWVIRQNLADAYLTFEVAQGSSIDYDVLVDRDPGTPSPWPEFPANTVIPNVTIGTLNNGQPVTGTLTRTRIQKTSPAVGNLLSMESLGIEMWELQSHLSYNIGERTYVKSRTIIRTE